MVSGGFASLATCALVVQAACKSPEDALTSSEPEQGPVEIATGLEIEALGIDQGSVYWTTPSGSHPRRRGSLMRVDKRGGTPVVLVASFGLGSSFTVDATGIYAELDGAVVLVSRSGGPEVELVPAQLGQRAKGGDFVIRDRPRVLGVDDGHLYFTTWGNATDERELLDIGTVHKAAKTGGAAIEILSDLASPRALAVDTESVYVLTDGYVNRARKDGTERTQFAEADGLHGLMAVDETAVYFMADEGFEHFLVRARKADGVVERLAKVADDPQGIAVDATHLYWTSMDGTVRAVAKGGGPPEVVFSGASPTRSIAADASGVYWASDDGVLRKLAQPRHPR